MRSGGSFLANMKKIFKNKYDALFWGIALVLLVFMVLYASFTIRYLTNKLNLVLGEGEGGKQLIVRFDFDKLNRILPGVNAPQAPIQ